MPLQTPVTAPDAHAVPGSAANTSLTTVAPPLRLQRPLSKSVRDALAGHGMPYRSWRTRSRTYLETPDVGAAEVLSRVFGLQSVSVAEPRPWTDLDDLVEKALPFF